MSIPAAIFDAPSSALPVEQRQLAAFAHIEPVICSLDIVPNGAVQPFQIQLATTTDAGFARGNRITLGDKLRTFRGVTPIRAREDEPAPAQQRKRSRSLPEDERCFRRRRAAAGDAFHQDARRNHDREHDDACERDDPVLAVAAQIANRRYDAPEQVWRG
jgi:hypothetical protein